MRRAKVINCKYLVRDSAPVHGCKHPTATSACICKDYLDQCRRSERKYNVKGTRIKEYSGKIDFWGLPNDEFMSCEDIVELVEGYLQDMELNEEKAEEEITIYGYVRTEIKKDRLIDRFMENLIEQMDEEYTIENRNTKIADIPAVRIAALKLIDTIIANGYKVETLDKVCEKRIKISDYIEEEKC